MSSDDVATRPLNPATDVDPAPALPVQLDDPFATEGERYELPPTATLVSMVAGTVGVLGVSLLFGRVYASEIRRAEKRMTFHAWQLKQLVPSDA